MNLIEHATHTQNTLDQLTTRINTLAAEHTAALAAKDSELTATKAAFAELSAYKDAMVARVSAVLQSGEPAQYEALARDFLTPAQEKERQAKVAQLEALKAQAAALEAELAK
jgi:hypothetical protein